MNKKTMVISLGSLFALNTLSAEAALSSTALLTIDPGFQTCDSTGYLCDMNASYFAVDTDNDGTFTSYESIALSPGSDGGLLIGHSQLASNSHTGFYPDGTEIAPIDAPWAFLGSIGMHQSTSPVNIISDDGAGNVQLDFSGWGVTWNGIANIGLGGDAANFSLDTGIATLVCAVDCSEGDSFVLDYMTHIPLADPSSLGGIYWKIHMEGTVSAIPVPAAVWLFGSGLLGLIGVARHRKS